MNAKTAEIFIILFTLAKVHFVQLAVKKRREQIAANVSRKIINVQHRQLVFTLPKELRGYFRLYKDQLSILFEAANESLVNILKNHAPKKFREEQRKIGAICFLHTFGRDLKRHPHIHVLFAEKDIFEEFVEFKCLDCGYEERIEGDIVFEFFDEEIEEYSTLDCPKCNVGNFVPKDIYKKIINKKISLNLFFSFFISFIVNSNFLINIKILTVSQ